MKKATLDGKQVLLKEVPITLEQLEQQKAMLQSQIDRLTTRRDEIDTEISFLKS